MTFSVYKTLTYSCHVNDKKSDMMNKFCSSMKLPPPPLQIVINFDGFILTKNFSSSIIEIPLYSHVPLSSIIFFCCGTIDEILEHLFVQYMFVEPEKRDTTLIQKMTTKFDAAISHVEKLLRDRKFVCGEE